MAFWRRLGYVLRRMGREFLIWGGVLLLVYLVADQYLLYRHKAALDDWRATYAIHFPVEHAQEKTCAALDALAAVPGMLETVAREMDPGVSISAQSIQSAGLACLQAANEITAAVWRDRIFSAEIIAQSFPPDDLARALAHAAAALTPRIDDVADCEGPLWTAPDTESYPAQYRDVAATLGLQLALSMVMAIEGDAEACTAALIATGRMLPRMHATPANTAQWLERRWIGALHVALAEGAITADGIEALRDVLERRKANPLHPLQDHTPENYELARVNLPMTRRWPVLKRVFRPYFSYASGRILETILRIAPTVAQPKMQDRMDVYAAIYTESESLVPYLDVAIQGQLTMTDSYERKLAELAVLDGMLLLEQERQRTGFYPATLRGVPVAWADDRGTTYTRDDDARGYRITRALPTHGFRFDGTDAPSPLHRVWIHRHEEIPRP